MGRPSVVADLELSNIEATVQEVRMGWKSEKGNSVYRYEVIQSKGSLQNGHNHFFRRGYF